VQDWKKTLIRKDATIQEAIEAIDDSVLKVALVIDEDRTLLGTVTDGDVRRGILDGISTDQSVKKVMNEEPFTVSEEDRNEKVIQLMKEHSIQQVPVVDETNRVVDLKILDEFFQSNQLDNPVVIMAGGLGTRLRPITREKPKPMVEVGGKPIMETLIRRLIEEGFHRFYITVNYMADKIKNYFGDGSKWGIDITYVEENEKLGTAGGLSLLDFTPEKPFLLMNSDLLTTISFSQLIDFHVDKGAPATMCVQEYDLSVPFGVVELRDQEIIAMHEKPTETYFVNAGIYVLNPAVLELIPNQECFHVSELFQKLLADSRKPVAFPIREYWMDVGRPEDLEAARSEYRNIFQK
jgi:dTDP-glucose pyrophosphorylase/predicted transcriptional regulator